MALSFQDKITPVSPPSNPGLSFADKITPITPTPTSQDIQQGSPMILGSLAAPAQALTQAIGNVAIAPAEKTANETNKILGDISTRFLALAHNETNPTKKAEFISKSQEAINSMQQGNTMIADLYQKVHDAQVIKTPFGTINPLNTDQPAGKIAENIAGTALKTVSAGIPSFAGFGAVHGAGQAMEQGGGVGDVLLKSAEEAIITKLFGYGLNKIGGPIVSYLGSKIPVGVKPFVYGAVNKVAGFLDSGPSVDIGAKTMENLAQKVANGADFVLSPTKITQSIANTEAVKNKVIENVKSDWNRIGGDYVKSNKILAKSELQGKDPIQFLSDRGVDPKSLISGGKFQTAEVANKLRTEDVVPFEKILNQTLEVAQQGQPPVNLSNVEDAAITQVKKETNLTAGQMESAVNGVKSEFEALGRKFPDGTITLPQLNIEKGKYWTNTKFDMTKPFQGDVNYAIGRAAKDTIQNNVKDVNIQGLNNFLGDHYNAAKFLDSINNRVAKTTIGQKLTGLVTKGITTAIGEGLGGIPGGIAGYLGGKGISMGLEQMPNPLRNYVLANMKVANPEVYKQAIEYLAQQEADRIGRLALPAPSFIAGQPYKGETKFINPDTLTPQEKLVKGISGPREIIAGQKAQAESTIKGKTIIEERIRLQKLMQEKANKKANLFNK